MTDTAITDSAVPDNAVTDIVAFVTELSQRDVKLRLDGEQLRINAPKGALTPPLVDQLKTRKAEVINFLRTYAQSNPVATITPTVRPAQLPLSFSQQRLWFLAQLNGAQPQAAVNADGAPASADNDYNSFMALRLVGPLQVAALSASFQQIAARHEVLRTTFPARHGAAYQQIQPVTVEPVLIDLTHLAGAEQATAVMRLAAQEAAAPFDLAQGPLWRVTLLTLGATEHVLLITMHHIISDGWSMSVMLRELSTFYAQHCSSAPDKEWHEKRGIAPLPPLPLQYADYAVWQRRQLQEGLLAEQLSYWTEQLADAPPLLTLPTDHPRPAVQRHQGAELKFVLPRELCAALKARAKQYNVTPFMLLQATFALLLARYAGQEDICIGTPVANRQHTAIEALIGFFVNTLVLRNDLTGNPTVRDFLARVRQMTVAAFERQAVPFELIVERLQPERTLAHSPLFQALFVLQNNRREPLALPGITVSTIEMATHVAKFDLTLMVWEADDAFVLSWRYNTDLFTAATITRMAGHYQTLLTGMIEQPRQRIMELPLLNAAERHQLLVTWNEEASADSRAADRDALRTIHGRFEAQVARTPDAVAVVCGDEQLTYRALNSRANQLAHQLIACGVGPDQVIGLYVERSLAMVIGLLAILKAGGAYAPLDPQAPPERLALMLADMQSTVIVTQSHLLAKLAHTNQQVIDIEADFGDQRPADRRNPATQVRADNLAYLLYTSGSTGTPKGVMVEHRQVLAYGDGVMLRCALEPGLRYAMVQPLTVDSSVTMLFPSLWTGGVLRMIDRETALNAAALATTFQRARIDCLKIAPSHLSALLAAAPEPQALLPAKRLIIGGEGSDWPWVQQLAATAPCQVYNHYGPTETTVGVLTYRVFAPSMAEPIEQTIQTTPLGRPLPNTQVYILDALQQPRPIGCWGELYIGGALVTRGYFRRPDLTAERFVANPFGAGNLYRTGDWARYLPDGTIEFYGRMDGQVKIRGFRIELGEIEAQLRTHPTVRDVVVLARERENGQTQLVAYVAVKDEAQGSRAEQPATLHAYLKQKLPDHMIPAAFVLLEALPLTPHGKVDRLALLAIPTTHDNGANAAARVAPRTPVEAALVAIWQRVLGLAQVGVTDNFFQSGGDSILSIQLVSHAREAGLQFTPKDLFQHQTIAELAGVVKPSRQLQAEQGIVIGAVPLTPIQQRFFAQGWRNPHHFNQAMLLALTPTVNPVWLAESLRALLVHHDGLRLRFTRQADGWQQAIIAPTEAIAFDIISLSAPTEDTWATQVAAVATEMHAGLQLSDGPLVRAALLQHHNPAQLNPDTDHLLIVIHHLAVDGVSWRILLEDLQRAYGQRANGAAIQLPPKSTSWQRWATLLHQRGAQAVAAERVYWQRVVQQESIALPVDLALGPNTYASTAIIATRLNAIATAALLNEAAAAYHTQINDLLLTALLLAFRKRLEDQGNQYGAPLGLWLDLEGHGREELFGDEEHTVDLARTVGWFTTIFPLWLAYTFDAGTITDLGPLIKQVKETLRQVPNRGIGYGILRYLAGAVELAGDPVVKFNYLGQAMTRRDDGDSLIQGVVTEAVGPALVGIAHSPHDLRTHLLEINASVIGDELRVNWIYSRNLHRTATIQALADAFVVALQAVIAHCQQADVGGYTPSDFPDCDLSQAELDLLLDEIAAANQQATPSRQPLAAIYPLAPSQQGILLESLAFPNSGIHIEQSLLQWQGELHWPAFDHAWQTLVARHTLLRTGFVWRGLGEPHQFVLRTGQMPIHRESLCHLAPAAQQAALDRYIAADRKAGFAPRQAPLMRLALLQTGQQRYHLLWTRHHILTDGWSTAILAREFLTLYRAACVGQSAPLPVSPPYQTYIRWLRRQDVAESEAFWRSRLQGFHTPTAVTTHAAAAEQPRSYASADAQLSAATTAALYQLAQHHGLTVNTLVQAGWALQLHHHSGATDILFGTTIAGRPAEIPDIAQMVGLFINTLPMRIQLEPLGDGDEGGGGSLLGWLQALQRQQLAQQAHAHCSAGQIHRWSEVPAAQPLYESLLVFENYRPGITQDDPVVAHSLPAALHFELQGGQSIGAQTNYALTLLVVPSATLEIRAVYDATRFEDGAMEQLLHDLIDRLAIMVASPEQPLRHFLRATAAPERPSLQARHNPRSAAFVPPRTILEQQLAQLWQVALGMEAVSIHDTFFELGGHSLVALQLMAQIQQRFGVNLPLAMIFQAPTIEQMALQLAELTRGWTADWSALVPIQPTGDKRPFFCVPGSGGNVLYLYELARWLGPQQPFYGLQAVGLDGTTPPLATVEEIAAHNVQAIQTVQPQGPYLLGGHSFGGKVAYAMAQQLIRAGHAVAQILLFDAAAPQGRANPAAREWDDAMWFVALAHSFGDLVGKASTLVYAELPACAPEEQFRRFQQELIRLQLLPPGADARQARGLVQVFRSQLLAEYAPKEVLPVPLTLFRAEDASPAPVATADADDALGWRALTNGTVTVVPVPGTHLSMMRRPHVAVLADRVRALLAGVA